MKAQRETLLSLNRLLLPKHIRLPAFDHPFHYHPEIEITYIHASSGTRVIGDNIGGFEAGELYLIGSNLPHVFRNTGDNLGNAEAEVLHLSCEAIGFLTVSEEFEKWTALTNLAETGLLFDAETSCRCARLLRQIRKARGVRTMAYFCELAETLISAPAPQTIASAAHAGKHHLSDPVARVCTRILREFSEPLSHPEMAREAGMTPAAFSRLFRRATRKSYTEFVTEVRLGHACRLLRETEHSVAEIAFASGFENLSHFNRRFRLFHRCSPKEYRRYSVQCIPKQVHGA